MMRTSTATVVFSSTVSLALTLALGACKGEKVREIDPQTKLDLDDCQKKQRDLAELNKTLSNENTRLQLEKGSGGEVLVAIEGNILTVKPGKPGSGPPPLDDKAAAAAAREFIDVVAKSRGAIQKCYEQALKAQTVSQAKTITLTVLASFTPQGGYRNASFAPSLGDNFDRCIQGVASKWALSVNAPSQQFRATVSLTPS